MRQITTKTITTRGDVYMIKIIKYECTAVKEFK